MYNVQIFTYAFDMIL